MPPKRKKTFGKKILQRARIPLKKIKRAKNRIARKLRGNSMTLARLNSELKHIEQSALSRKHSVKKPLLEALNVIYKKKPCTPKELDALLKDLKKIAVSCANEILNIKRISGPLKLHAKIGNIPLGKEKKLESISAELRETYELAEKYWGTLSEFHTP